MTYLPIAAGHRLIHSALLASTFVLAYPIGVKAQQTPFTPELMWSLERVSDEALSPDGQTVAFTIASYKVDENKGRRDVAIVRLAAPGKFTRLTGPDANESAPQWRPDGKKIAYLAARDGVTQVWEMNPDGSGQTPVTSFKTDVDAFKYAGNGGLVVATKVKLDKSATEQYPDLPKTSGRIIDGLLYRHWTTWADGSYNHVFYVPLQGGKAGEAKDLMPGERFHSPIPPHGGAEDFNASPDGRYIAYASRKLHGTEEALSTNSDIYLYDTQTGKTENLSAPNPGYDKFPVFSPDGKKLAWASMARNGFEADKQRLMLMDLATRKAVDLTSGFDEGIATMPCFSPDGKTIYAPVNHRGTEQIFTFNTTGEPKAKQLTQGRHNLLSIQAQKGTLISLRTAMDAPADIVRLNARTGAIEPVTMVNKDRLTSVAMAQVAERTVKTSDNKDMLVWVIYPPGFDKTKKYPTVLFCQGGPQSPVSQNFSYRWNFMAMASQGYIVVAPNRRGLPGFGREWNDQISGDWGGQPMRDYLAAIDDVSKEPYVDKDRLGCVGASYGGYSVFMLASMHQKRFKTFIAHAGVYNLETMFGTTEEVFFDNWEHGGPPWQKPQPKSYTEFSPHRFVDKWDTPILIIHGALDFRVPEGQGMDAFTAAQVRGIPSKFLYFPDEGHWILKPQNSLLWHREFYSWLDKYLKSKA